MSHKGLSEPHVLLASGNPRKMIRNLSLIFSEEQLGRIQGAVNSEAALLYKLAENHRDFALAIDASQWWQVISRLYYAAYNARRALTLINDGAFSTDASDHKNVDGLPDGLQNKSTYANKLKNLREDRNLFDYSHLASEQDLMISVVDAKGFVSAFMAEAHGFLLERGVAV
ncbi:hypothetical protein [Stenotrophomonas maltophilia]|uniref:hypothetical protein n=1 Tax=Stenotrophomonas maltophilia TaxID=40324 RepID=UPI0011B7B9C6|nr:hypothetical protein [Stenotrophomonas maltophilia]